MTKRHSRVPGITSPTINIGLIAGGINTNVVPDRVTFRLDRRLIADAGPPFRGITVEIKRILLATPLVPQPGWETLVAAIREPATTILKTDIPVAGVPLYTDARHYAARGIPCVLYGAGPRTLLEANGHNADENLRLADLRAATKIVALAAAKICRGAA